MGTDRHCILSSNKYRLHTMMDHTLLLGVILSILHLGEISTSQIAKKGSLMAIGGYGEFRSVEVLNTSCSFPLPDGQGRWGHFSVTTRDGKTLVCGGRIPNAWFTASCLQFNYTTKCWEPFHSLKSKFRDWSSVVTLSGGVYVLGGYDYEDASTTSELLPTGHTKWIPGPRLPGKVYQSCVAKLDDTAFVVLGGWYDKTQAMVYIETNGGKWIKWPRLTQGVYVQSCVGLPGAVLMAGGLTDRGHTRRTIFFDRSKHPREVAPLKNPRGGAAMVVIGGKPVILGGTDIGGQRRDGEMWNMDTETWEKTDISLNIPRSSYSLVTLAKEIDCD